MSHVRHGRKATIVPDSVLFSTCMTSIQHMFVECHALEGVHIFVMIATMDEHKHQHNHR